MKGEKEDELMAQLRKRIEGLREEEEENSRIAHANWLAGKCSHRTVAIIEDWVRGLKFHENTLALGTFKGPIFLMDMETRKVKLRLDGHTDEVSAIDFDGAIVATGSLDTSVRVWMDAIAPPEDMLVMGPDGEDFPVYVKEPIVFHHSGAVTGVKLLGGECISCSLDGTVKVWDLRENRCIQIVEVGGPVTCCSASAGVDAPQGSSRYLVAGTEGGELKIFAMDSWREILSVSAHSGAVTSVHFDGYRQLVTGGADGLVKVWDIDQGGSSIVIRAHNAPVASIQGDAMKIVSGGLDGSVRVWDARTGTGILQIWGHTAYLGSVQFEGGRLVTDGTNNVVVLHDFINTDYKEEPGDIFE